MGLGDEMTQLAVMVVEDEGPQREALSEFLRWRGFTVFAFASGRDAVDWLASPGADIDAAIVDWHLPGVGGQGVVEALRERFPSAPVVVASGSPLSAAERRSGRWSAAMRKPFSMRKMVGLLTDLMGETNPPA